jgi:hypothetical protein
MVITVLGFALYFAVGLTWGSVTVVRQRVAAVEERLSLLWLFTFFWPLLLAQLVVNHFVD